MGNVPFIPFEEVKAAYSVEELMEMTGLKWKKDGKSFRASCPQHGGGPRSLVVTPDKNDDKGGRGCFYCHASEQGGDRVSLLAHVRNSKPYAVFKELHERKPSAPQPVPEESQPAQKEGAAERGFKPLPYLTFNDPAVLALGIPPEVLEATGLGFAPRGLHRGRVAIPLRLADGVIVGYISIEANTSVQLPPRWAI